MRSVEKLHDKLVTSRRRLVAKFDPATLASLATIMLALMSTEKVLRESGSSSV